MKGRVLSRGLLAVFDVRVRGWCGDHRGFAVVQGGFGAVPRDFIAELPAEREWPRASLPCTRCSSRRTALCSASPSTGYSSPSACSSATELMNAPSRGRAATLGVLLGLTILTRGEAVLLVPLLLVSIVRRPRGGRAALIACCAAVIVIAPWTVRNWTVFHQFVPISTNSASAIAGAKCPTTFYGSKIGSWDDACIKSYPRQRGGRV
jgi:hypothetical protein